MAVLDPPRSGAGREIIDLLAAAEVPGGSHRCQAARSHAMSGCTRARVPRRGPRVFDSFPLTHHVECVAVLTAPILLKSTFRRESEQIMLFLVDLGEPHASAKSSLQPPVPVAEQRDSWPRQRESPDAAVAKFERDAIGAHGFPVIAGRHAALALARSRRHHLVDLREIPLGSSSAMQSRSYLCRTPNSRSQARPIGALIGTSSTVSDSVPRGIDMVIMAAVRH